MKTNMFLGKMQKSLLTGLFALVVFGLASCSDMNNPVSSTNNSTGTESVIIADNFTINSSEMISVDFASDGFQAIKVNSLQGGDGNTGSGDKKGGGGPVGGGDKGGLKPGGGPMGLPPCLNLTADQQAALKLLYADYNTKIQAQRDALNAKLRDIKTQDSLAMVDLKAKFDAIKQQVEDLRKQEKAIMDQMRTLEKDFRSQADAIRKSYKDKFAAATTKEEKAALKTAMDDELKALKDTFTANANALRDQQKALRAQADALGLKDIEVQRKAIQDASRAKIKAAQDEYNAAIAPLYQELLTQIRAMLTADQQVLFDKWQAGTNPCANTSGGGRKP